jgi:hypothetical protein
MWDEERQHPRIAALGYTLAILITIVVSLLLGGCGGGDVTDDDLTIATVTPSPAAPDHKFIGPPDCSASGVCQ